MALPTDAMATCGFGCQSIWNYKKLSRFDGITLDAITRQPVRLEHIYMEVTQA